VPIKNLQTMIAGIRKKKCDKTEGDKNLSYLKVKGLAFQLTLCTY
jgi:hypothetical protein